MDQAEDELAGALERFFNGQDLARQIFEAVRAAQERVGPAELRVSKSQVGFRRRRVFAMVWMPEMYLHRKAAPLVLTVSLHERDGSPRWKEIVEARPGYFTHHLELYGPEEVDEAVRGWLQAAWLLAA